MSSLVESCKNDPKNGSKYEKLCSKLGFFLEEALYNYDERLYPPCKNILDTLRKLKNDGYHLALLSNRRKSSVEKILGALSLKDLFEKIEAPDSDEPEIKEVNHLLQYFKVQKDETIFVGDSSLDIKSGKEFGLITIGVLSGMGTLRMLKKAEPDYIINDVSEIYEIINKIKEGKNDQNCKYR